MYNTTVAWTNIADVKKFVDIANKYLFDISLSLDKYVINAKSIMGIFSFNLCEKISLKANCDPDSPFIKEIEPFIAV